jgi:hypothetical protein
MSSDVVEETSEGTADGAADAKGTAEANGAAEAKEPNQCSNCFMSRVTLDMVA